MRHALGICDRCGFSYKLTKLQPEYTDRVPNGLLVCWRCFDKDHPQLQVGKRVLDDPKPLMNPRPEVRTGVGFGLFGWNPVGNDAEAIRLEGGSV